MAYAALLPLHAAWRSGDPVLRVLPGASSVLLNREVAEEEEETGDLPLFADTIPCTSPSYLVFPGPFLPSAAWQMTISSSSETLEVLGLFSFIQH